MGTRILIGDCLATLPTLAAESVQCCVTSPPYYGLRFYSGGAAEIGTESTPDEYVAALVDVFRAVRRVLHPSGVVFLNLGDSYASPTKGSGGEGKSGLRRDGRDEASRIASGDLTISHQKFASRKFGMGDAKPKDLLGIPWQVAFALRADGWWLRSAIVWAKPNPMPESVTDRPTSAHEMVFLLTKSPTYFYDPAAIAEPSVIGAGAVRNITPRNKGAASTRNDGDRFGIVNDGTRNARNVWSIASQPCALAHFATMPAALAERCIRAGSKPGDTILDPFSGAGTTCLVADRLGRDGIGCELNPAYAALSTDRVTDDAPLFARVAAE